MPATAWWAVLDVHAEGGAGGDGVADSFDLHDAKAAGPEGLEARIVAKGGDLLAVAFGDLVDCFALAEVHGLAIERHGGGAGVVGYLMHGIPAIGLKGMGYWGEERCCSMASGK